MDSTNDFERQIAAEIDYEVGPPHPVDALAITRTAKTPSSRWRIRFMFTPVKAITAGALVFALGSLMLVARPVDRQGNVPGVATDDPAMAPSFFSGTFEMMSSTEPVSERREDGVVERRGESYTVSWDANDPRITGAGTYTLSETDYREGATTLAPTGDTGTIWTGVLRIANETGSWEGSLQHVYIPNSDWSNAAGWLSGTGDYEGLSAYVVWWDATDGVHGHITAEGPPPA